MMKLQLKSIVRQPDESFDVNSEEEGGIEKKYINKCEVCGFQVEADR